MGSTHRQAHAGGSPVSRLATRPGTPKQRAQDIADALKNPVPLAEPATKIPAEMPEHRRATEPRES